MSTAKRAGARRRPRTWPTTLGLAAGTTAAMVAWGYLVWMAIDFGQSARSGSSARWALLALAALGAICCLFTALLLAVRLARSLKPARASMARGPSDPTAAVSNPYGPPES